MVYLIAETIPDAMKEKCLCKTKKLCDSHEIKHIFSDAENVCDAMKSKCLFRRETCSFFLYRRNLQCHEKEIIVT